MPAPIQSLTRLQRLYRQLVVFYPTAFRRQYESLLVQLFDDMYRDGQSSPPSQRRRALAHAFTDTLQGALREHYQQLIRKGAMNTQPQSFWARHRLALIITGGVIVIGLASLLTNLWDYNGPVNRLERVIADGQRIEQLADSNNTGWDNVAANFVADYIQAKYYGNKRTDVGYRSIHAAQTHTTKDGTMPGLEQNTHGQYSSMAPNFDPLTCSTQAPISVRYIRESDFAPGFASMIADFRYAPNGPDNLVRYQLMLNQERSRNGDWQIIGVDCLSLEGQDHPPFTQAVEATANEQAYDHRNDRSFGTGN